MPGTTLRIQLCSLLLGVIALAIPRPAAALEYHDAAAGYSISLPEGWVRIPADALAKMNAAVAGTNSHIRYDAGFQPAGHDWFTYPYVLTMTTRYPVSREPSPADMRQISKAITGMTAQDARGQLSQQAQGLLQSVSNDQPSLDVDAGIVEWGLKMSVAGRGRVRGAASGHFGHTSISYVYCYDLEPAFPTSEPAFRTIAASFRFDPASALRHDSAGFDWNGVAGKALIGAIVGGLVGLAVALFRKFAVKKP